MARYLSTKPRAIQLVGKQHFFTAQRCYRYRCIQAFQNSGEALVRSRQFFANAPGLGDVGHRRHPASLLAFRVNQGRHVHAGIKNLTIFALHTYLKTTGWCVACQLIVESGHGGFNIVFGPVREGWHPTHQIRFLQTRHLAKGRVYVSDAACHVERTHTRQHGVFHRSAKIGFFNQRLLRLHTAPCMAPGAQQHPDGQRAQGTDQPEKPAAHHAQRRLVALRSY